MKKAILFGVALITAIFGIVWLTASVVNVYAQCINQAGLPCTPTPAATATSRGGGGGGESNGQICVGAFLDSNSNGSFDGADSWLGGGFAHITNLSTSAVTQSDFQSSGRTCHFLPGNINYTVAETSPPSPYAANPTVGPFMLSVGGVVNVDFPHSVAGGNNPCSPSLTAGSATCTPTPTGTVFTQTPCPGQQSPTAPCTPTATRTVSFTATPTATPCVSSANLAVALVPESCTPTPRVTNTPTATPCVPVGAVTSPNALCTSTPTPTNTPTPTPCIPVGAVVSPNALCTNTPTPTITKTPTGTLNSPTPTLTPTGTLKTPTPTKTPTGTITPPTPTPTFTPSATSITTISLNPPGSVPVTGVLATTCTDWLVFHSNRDKFGRNWEIYRLDGIEGQSTAKLFNLSNNDAADFTPSRSADDKWVAFHSFRDKHGEIYITDREGKKQVRLTTTLNGSSVKPLFSPNNQHLVFQSNRTGDWNLYLLDIGKTPLDPKDDKLTQLTNSPSSEQNPSWSPDGAWLTFESDYDGTWNIYLLNLATRAQYRLTNGPLDNRDAAWSPTGKLIAYRSFVKGYWVLYTIQPNGSSQTAVSPVNQSISNHAWSHDSTRLAYQSSRDKNYDIYVVSVTTRREIRLTSDKALDVSPVWNCTDESIAFTTVRTGNAEVYQVPSGGGAQTAMTNNRYSDQWPEWTPLTEAASRQLP